MREIDTSNPQQLQVHYFMVNCRCLEKENHLNQTSSFGGFSMFSTVFLGRKSHGNPVIFRAAVNSRLCLLLSTHVFGKSELLLIYISNEFHITNFNHLRRFSLSPACLGIPYWIILRGFLRFCCHQFYTTHLAGHGTIVKCRANPKIQMKLLETSF